MCKYFLNEKEKCIVRSKDGEIMRPSCIDDVILYHAYLGADSKEAQHLLKDIFHGEKVISKMVETLSKIPH